MSHPYYTKLWADTAKSIGDVLRQDQLVQGQSPFNKREPTFRIVADLYVRYLKLTRNLDVCYDQVTQPQKRPLIRHLLDMSIARLLEMRNLLRELDISDYSYFHEVLLEHRMTPFDLEMSAPRYFRFGEPREDTLLSIDQRIDFVHERTAQRQAEEEAEKEKALKKSIEESQPKPEEEKKEGRKRKSELALEERKSLAEEARARQAELDRIARLERQGIDPETGQLTKRGAVKLIQRHERARQARVAFGGKKVEFVAKRRQLMGMKPIKRNKKKMIAAAIIIQKWWRGYRTRLLMKSKDTQMMMTLGLAMPSYYSDVQRKIAEEVCAMRRIMQAENRQNFDEELAKETVRWMKRKAPWLREDLTDQIRNWFIVWYNKAGEFAPYPTEEQGGGMAIVDKRLVSPEKYLQKKERLKREKELIKAGKKGMTDAQMDKKKLKEMKKKEKAAKKAAAKERKKKIKAGQRLVPWEMPETDAFPELMEAYGEYKDFWRGRDETDDPLQRLEMDLLRAQVAAEGTRAVRLEVDEFMRLELEVLNEALLRDKGKKGKKKKKGKGKKGKKKKKKEKPPPNEEEIWESFYELVENGIIKKTPPTFLKDFRGDLSYMTGELRKALTTPDPLHSLGEVRQVVMETCIMPLGCRMAHSILPLVRSVCIFGLPRSGTTMLARAVCWESGSLVFDFSADAICNSPYMGGAGIKRFMKIVGDVARYFQPSIFLVDSAEKPFYKKVPKEEKEMKPKQAAKHLKKMLKTIKQDDQILIVGATSQINNTKGAIKKTFEKWIFVPPPDYSTVVMTWNDEVMKHYLVDRDFLSTPLAMETMNYSMENIIDGVDKHLNLSRQLRLKNDPLTQQELLTEMFNYEQYNEKEKKKIMKWYNKSIPTVKYKNKVLVNERIEAGLDPPPKKKKK